MSVRTARIVRNANLPDDDGIFVHITEDELVVLLGRDWPTPRNVLRVLEPLPEPEVEQVITLIGALAFAYRTGPADSG